MQTLVEVGWLRLLVIGSRLGVPGFALSWFNERSESDPPIELCFVKAPLRLALCQERVMLNGVL
jgi:hypothetical protein